MLTYSFIFFISCICSTLIYFLFIYLFYTFKILDNPKKYWKKRKAIPYGIGITFFLIFFLVSFFFMEHEYKLYLIWFFWAFVSIVSFLDDRMNVSPKIRLFIQIFIGMIIWLTSIKIGYVSNIFWGIIDLETIFIEVLSFRIYLVPLIFTIIWYVFVFNALNWTDGITGNTSLLSLICFIVIFLLGLKLYFSDIYAWGVENAKFIMQMSLILISMLFVYIFLDLKEKVLMGDAGTMFLGFMLATLAIIAGGKIATVLAVFWIYAVDAVYVVVRRIVRKKNPLTGDYTHLHHRLLEIGLTEKQVLTLIASLSFIFGFTALFLETLGKIVVFCIIICFVLLLSYIGERVKKIHFKK